MNNYWEESNFEEAFDFTEEKNKSRKTLREKSPFGRQFTAIRVRAQSDSPTGEILDVNEFYNPSFLKFLN